MSKLEKDPEMAERFKQVRAELGGINQDQLAELIDMHPKTYAAYEGKTFPTAHVLYSLARLGINLHWLITGEGPIKISNSKNEVVKTKSYDLIRILDDINSILWNPKIDSVAKHLFVKAISDSFFNWRKKDDQQ